MVEDPLGAGVTFLPAACKGSAHNYYVLPNLSSHTYTWTVTGGTPQSTTGTPNVIVWGWGSFGEITVIASSGGCADTINMRICLVDPPEADFSFSPTSPCANVPVSFDNNSSGALSYLWDFGDGNTSTDVNPSHAYTSSGTYTVLLTAFGDCEPPHHGEEGRPGDDPDDPTSPEEPVQDCMCCRDTVSMQITVQVNDGPDIFPTVCEEICGLPTLCPGDTASFCTSSSCTDWSVSGGSIVNNSGNCIDVVWNGSYTAPTVVSLACAGGSCATPTELYAPVFYPSLPIDGSTALCQNETATFSLPSMPGTYYSWSVTAPYSSCYSFAGSDSNSAEVGIKFNCTGTYTITCDYNNPLADCGPGQSTTTVEVKQAFQIYWGNDLVCVDGTGNYGATGPSTWTISPTAPISVSGSAQTPTIDFSGVAPGIYTITATANTPSNYCNPSDEYQVEVIAPPVMTAITGEDYVCPGDYYVYNIGSNTMGYPFEWSITGGTIETEMGDWSDSVVVTWDNAGPFELTVSQSITPPGCKSDTTFTVELIDPPVISSGPDTVCVDATESYTATVANGSPDEYNWSIIPSEHGTITTGQGTSGISVLWHAASGNAMLIVETCSGADTIDINVTDLPNVNISPNDTPIFCEDSSFTLTMTAVPANPSLYNYSWTGPSIIGSTTNPTCDIDISSLPPGFHSYQVTISKGGCSRTSNIVEVEIMDCVPAGGGGGCLSSFRAYFDCTNNVSIVMIEPSTGFTGTYNWSISPTAGTTIANPSLSTPTDPGITVSASGTYTITLNPTGCSPSTETIDVLLPDASISISPSPVCVGIPASFTPSPAGSAFRYEWDFGDGSSSYIQNPSHAYLSSGTYTVTMVVFNDEGCVDTAETTITVYPETPCEIAADDTTLCPGQSATLTASCSGVSSYQWYREGSAISGATSSTYTASDPGEYQLLITDSNGCEVWTNTIYMLLMKNPVAKITGEDNFCSAAGGSITFPLQTVYDGDYAYQWSAPWQTSGITGVSFATATIAAPQVTVSRSGSSTADTVLIVVEVTDTTTGCKAYDSLCVNINNGPVIDPPSTYCHDGTAHTFSTSSNPDYTYLWSNGMTGNSISVIQPGEYAVTVTDLNTGCSETQVIGTILEKPDLSLYPRGCDSLCIDSTFALYVPLPLEPGMAYPTQYSSITWLDGSTDITPSVWAPGTLSFQSSTEGLHEISVIVEEQNGCKDTSEVYCIYVYDCSEEPDDSTCRDCCQDFRIRYSTEIEGSGSSWSVSTDFTTGPDNIYEIRANLVNFYMNNQPGCNRCVPPGASLGSIVTGSTMEWGDEEVDPSATCKGEATSTRELVWNLPAGEALQARPPLNSENITFELATPPGHPFQGKCCCDTIWFCVNWTFTDASCRSCDTVICYMAGDSCADIDNPGGGSSDLDCECDIESVLIDGKEIEPGSQISVSQGTAIPMSIIGGCNPADCETEYFWQIRGRGGEETLTGQEIEHIFEEEGRYRIKACIVCSGDEGDTCCIDFGIVVKPADGNPCRCRIKDMRIKDKPIEDGGVIELTGPATFSFNFDYECQPEGNCRPRSTQWQVTKPGGSTETFGTGDLSTQLEYTFNSPGTYTIEACVNCAAVAAPWQDSKCCYSFQVKFGDISVTPGGSMTPSPE